MSATKIESGLPQQRKQKAEHEVGVARLLTASPSAAIQAHQSLRAALQEAFHEH